MINKNSFKILKSSKKYIFFAAVLFFISFFLGILFVKIYPSLAADSLEELAGAFSFLFDLNPLQMGVFIFLNNTIKAFLFMSLGILLAIPTLIFIIVNGWVLGFVVALIYPEIGIGGLFKGLFFHGIFEISALLIASGIGIFLGVESVKAKKNIILIKEKLLSAMTLFLYIIIPLLFIAALIETLIIFYY